jgi:pimeloyl-ACP methyl ester carboxylesterase
MKKNIDYKFSNGDIRYQTTAFDDAGWAETGSEQSSGVIDAPAANSEQLTAVRAELRGGKVAAMGGGAVEFALLNHENPASNGAIVYNMGIGGDFHHPVGAREAEVLASVNPDKRIVVINPTGSGQSSLIPREIMGQMKREGVYGPQGEWMLQILSSQLEEFGDKIELWGNSAGARVAMGMAAAFAAADQKIASLRVVDPPSAADRTPLGIRMRFASQIIAMRGYGASPYNEAAELGKAPANLFKAKGAFADNMWNYPVAMRRKDGLAADLSGAMGAVRDDLTIIQPEFSEFAHPGYMQAMMGDVAMDAFMAGSAQPEALRHILIRDHSHAILSANAGARPQITLYEIAKRIAAQEK